MTPRKSALEASADRIAFLEKENDRLCEAVSLFADQNNWQQQGGGCGEPLSFRWEPTPLKREWRNPALYAQAMLNPPLPVNGD